MRFELATLQARDARDKREMIVVPSSLITLLLPPADLAMFHRLGIVKLEQLVVIRRDGR